MRFSDIYNLVIASSHIQDLHQADRARTVIVRAVEDVISPPLQVVQMSTDHDRFFFQLGIRAFNVSQNIHAVDQFSLDFCFNSEGYSWQRHGMALECLLDFSFEIQYTPSNRNRQY